MDKNKQILETLQMQPLSEEEKKSRHILGRLYGPIATCNEATRNGRKYNRDLWEKALADDVFNEKIAKKCLFLELGHPLDREETIMEKVCACIPACPKIVDGDLYAYVDILDTPNGKILKTLCDYGFVPGISSRGSGDIMSNDEVDPETFFLETWDIVALPAVKKARLTVCESLDNNQLKLKKALTESYNAASAEDKLIIKEALDNLELSLDFPEPTVDVDDDIPYENPEVGNILAEDDDEEVEVEETTTEEETDDVLFNADEVKDVATDVATKVADCDEDDEDCAETIKDVVNDTVDKAVEAKLDNEQAEDDSVEDKEAEPVEDNIDEVDDSSEEAIDDGADEVLENLKEMIRQKGLLESEVKKLRADKAVSDAEVKGLREDLNKYKTGFVRMSELAANSSKFEKEVQKLNEQLTQKEKLIQGLQKSVDNVKLTESVNAHDSKVKSLTEKLDAMQKDLTASENKLNEQKSQYKSKLTEAVGIAKTYKSKYDAVMSKYIETRASMLGVKPATIVNELHENYSIEDVDRVCEELLESNVRYNNLPFGLNANTRIRFNESKSNTKKQSSYADGGYEIDDSLLELAGLKK